MSEASTDTWKSKREKMDEALKHSVMPLLRILGFRGSYPHFRRKTDERVDVLGFQFSNWGPAFYVEIGVADVDGYTWSDGTHFPAKTIKHYECPSSTRIGEQPFDFEVQSAHVVADQVSVAVNDAQGDWAELHRILKTRGPGHGYLLKPRKVNR
jgi:Domain of unknown function (DUF4304)